MGTLCLISREPVWCAVTAPRDTRDIGRVNNRTSLSFTGLLYMGGSGGRTPFLAHVVGV